MNLQPTGIEGRTLPVVCGYNPKPPKADLSCHIEVLLLHKTQLDKAISACTCARSVPSNFPNCGASHDSYIEMALAFGLLPMSLSAGDILFIQWTGSNGSMSQLVSPNMSSNSSSNNQSNSQWI